MNWFEACYSRLLIDSHISEDDPSFLAKIDPAQYVEMVKRAGVDSAMVYSCCHNGNCYYPTKVGHMHKNLKGRDIFGEIVSLLRQEGITPLAYYTIVFHNESAKNHPSWRVENCNGVQSDGRYWWSCPNNPEYRAFIKSQIAEVVSYTIAGIFVDMTFWPGVCTCHSCRSRYLRENGTEIPGVIDWGDEKWVNFQRARERWIAECAKDITDSLKASKPEVSVTHQCSPVIGGWRLAYNPGIAAASDYSSGDFYYGKQQHQLAAKVLSAFSTNVPFEYHTSRCVDLRDHTSTKSEDEMLCDVAVTMSNGGAYVFIDAINPDGTLSEDVYDRLNSVNSKAVPFKEKMIALRPVITADVGLFFSTYSHIYEKDNGKTLAESSGSRGNMAPDYSLPLMKERLGTAVALNRANIPYKIISSGRVDLNSLKTLIINNCAFLPEDEAEKIRSFVRDGGTLIATGKTSLYNLSGQTSGDFGLKDVFGVSYSGKNSESVSYLAFDGDADSFPGQSRSKVGRTQFVLSNEPGPLVTATTASVLALVIGTCFKPRDPDHYASIHSDPPGPSTPYHGLSVNTYGKGKCVYLYSSLLGMQNHAQQTFGELLLKQYASSGIILSSNAPACVEVTLLKSTTRDAYLLCFVNYQIELPNVEVRDTCVTLRLPEGTRPKSCRRVSDGQEMDFDYADGAITVTLPRLETLEMLELNV